MVTGILIYSCSKQDLEINTSSTEKQGIKYSINIPYENVTIEQLDNGRKLLSFKDEETILKISQEIKNARKTLMEDFVKKYGELEGEAFDEIADEIGFNEYQPLIDFGERLNFQTLFQYLYDEETKYLEAGGDNIEEDPDNHFIIETGMRIFFNTNEEVKIGNNIYKLLPEGYFKITDGNIETLQYLTNGSIDFKNLPTNVEFVGEATGEKAAGCASGKDFHSYLENSSNTFRIRYKVGHHTPPPPWNRRVIAKTKNYYCKRLKNGKCKNWKRATNATTSMVFGFVSGTDSNGNANCDTQFNFNSSNSGVTSYGHEIEHKINVSTKTLSGWVRSTHVGIAGINRNHTLIW